MSPCDCSMCRDARRDAVPAAPVEPMPVERMPKGLANLRKTVVDYYKHPEKHLDMSTLVDRGDGDFRVQGKSFEDATGLTRLGSGAFAIVYAIDETRVLKVIRREDSGYARFARMVRNNQRNPHFPKIYYRGEWAGKTVYILERLVDYSRDGISDRYDDDVNDNFRQAITNGHDGNPFISLATAALREAATLLQGMTDDLHRGNVMFRQNADGTRTPVVTDPSTD